MDKKVTRQEGAMPGDKWTLRYEQLARKILDRTCVNR
jgi:hypothetical protein